MAPVAARQHDRLVKCGLSLLHNRHWLTTGEANIGLDRSPVQAQSHRMGGGIVLLVPLLFHGEVPEHGIGEGVGINIYRFLPFSLGGDSPVHGTLHPFGCAAACHGLHHLVLHGHTVIALR